MEKSAAIVAKPRQRANGLASVLAIGTANPSNVFDQSEFPDFYFNITNSNHMTDVKAKFERMCEKSGVKKRHLHLSEELLSKNPNLCDYGSNSMDVRQDILVAEVPKLGKEAALKAIEEWRQPISTITHLIFCTTTGSHMPGADYALIKLLGLHSTVKRVMLYHLGCFAGGTVLRIAKDLVENTKGARVLIVCSEITIFTFRGPYEAHLDNLVGQALFGDGASAMIVGADPIPDLEKPWFEIHFADTTIVPGSDHALVGHIREMGMVLHFMKEVPHHIAKNIESITKKVFNDAFGENAPKNYNDLFWIVHPGGPAILDGIEKSLHLNPGKMHASREVLSQHGNMFSPCVFFIMDLMRKRSINKNCITTGEGLDWGVLFGFGPGLTVETVVLKSVPINMNK